MKEINGLISRVIEPKQGGPKIEKTPTGGADFAQELEKTVAQLENLGSEIDALLEGENQNSSQLKTGVSTAGNMIQSMQGLVETFSPEKEGKATTSAKFAASQYERMNPKKS